MAYERLKRRLRLFGVRQISIFADACRALPQHMSDADLTADAVLGLGPDPAAKTPAVDKFVAAQDGATTFAVPGDTPDEDRCLFSGVLLEGLWGLKREAFSKTVPNAITSSSLGSFLESEVPLRAKAYSWNVVPNVVPAFPEGDNVYFVEGSAIVPPVLAPWPESIKPRPAEQVAVTPPRLDVSGGPVAGLTLPGRPPVLGIIPLRSAETPVAPGTAKSSHSGEAWRKRIRAQAVPLSFETGSGFAVDGAPVTAVWTDRRSRAGLGIKEGWWHVGRPSTRSPIGVDYLKDPAPVLIEFEGGSFSATTALPHFIASVLCESRGVSALIYRTSFASSEDVDVTARALAQLESGSLRAAGKTNLATELRRLKHLDPVLGVISAYLYDSVGDVDSIRRMAYYYALYGQAIPYDIALLGQLQGELRKGRLLARVPAVNARQPRTDAEAKAEWTHAHTPETEGVVGGAWPWMRQGWTYLDDLGGSTSLLVAPGLVEVFPHVESGRFATLDSDGAKQLIDLFGLRPWRAEGTRAAQASRRKPPKRARRRAKV